MSESNRTPKRTYDKDLFPEFEQRGTVGEAVLRRFIGLLREGRLEPGDKLPPERELASMLGVSRPSVRQALSALGLIGVVEARQGSGTYVAANLDRLPLEPFLYRLLLNQGEFDELMHLRMLIEPAVAALAAQRETDEDLKAIHASFERYESSVDKGVEAEAEAGRAFHQAIAHAAAPHTLVNLLEGLNDLIEATGRLIGAERRGVSLEAHRAILVALSERDAPRSEQLMREHLEDVNRRVAAATAAAEHGGPVSSR
jgi:DNA-binding FadR family transcriptional regulator